MVVLDSVRLAGRYRKPPNRNPVPTHQYAAMLDGNNRKAIP
ncbi:MAG TPA: hypothetical protein PLB10_18020 [Thiolinea sp.]|nr:hypothetical protein [Thiolinea sp.]